MTFIDSSHVNRRKIRIYEATITAYGTAEILTHSFDC
jgi:hypothetical protein